MTCSTLKNTEFKCSSLRCMQYLEAGMDFLHQVCITIYSHNGGSRAV